MKQDNMQQLILPNPKNAYSSSKGLVHLSRLLHLFCWKKTFEKSSNV